MKKSEFKRAKMGQLPGDVHRSVKIKMLEKDAPIEVSSRHIISEKAAKSFRKDQKRRAKAKFNQRQIKEVKNELKDLGQ